MLVASNTGMAASFWLSPFEAELLTDGGVDGWAPKPGLMVAR